MGGGGGGGTPIFSYIHMACWTIFEKMNIFGGMKKLWIWGGGGGGGYSDIFIYTFEGSIHYWTNLGGHFYTFKGFFLRQGE